MTCTREPAARLGRRRTSFGPVLLREIGSCSTEWTGGALALLRFQSNFLGPPTLNVWVNAGRLVHEWKKEEAKDAEKEGRKRREKGPS